LENKKTRTEMLIEQFKKTKNLNFLIKSMAKILPIPGSNLKKKNVKKNKTFF
jgi:hypothetical protein